MTFTQLAAAKARMATAQPPSVFGTFPTVTPQNPAHPGLSRVAIGAMPEPDPVKLHPYRWQMRLHANLWRILRKHRPHEAYQAKMEAISYHDFHKIMTEGEAAL